MTLKT